ncbi:voltage-gated chloride channel family protein [Robbsia sp. KACC 23696]|uniref:voltage-gated chloride channel family protein n=1 Tax=Robbsia sp. KACC 23696 TaxID=3149231 RepID=UPI00325A968C
MPSFFRFPHRSRRLSEPLASLPYFAKWFLLSGLVALLSGTASAWFLIALEHVTALREQHHGIVWLLPFAGCGVGWLYHRYGKSVERGNNLLIDEIHDPQRVVPLRMAPLVMFGTLVSHCFGASVGREGTAVQMGGALADQLTHLFKLEHADRRILLMSGISAGFASVFGTPLAGTVFGLEVLAIGRMRYDALLPCLIASLVADSVCRAWGAIHTHYAVGQLAPLGVHTVIAVLLAGVLFGPVGMAFARATHAAGAWIKRLVPFAPLRPLIGGALIATAVWWFDAYHYIGLGIPDIVRAFDAPMRPWDFLGKFVYTVASLGSGFKGGEVTPLFYIGATLGNALGPLLHLPVSMLAALGFVAVFAGAANTPMACILMAVELFGAGIGPMAALACITAYLFSGHAGIYHAQRIEAHKYRREATVIAASARVPEPETRA